MEPDVLTQRHYLEQRTVRLLDNVVELTQKGFFSGSTLRFPFEQIPEQTLTVTSRPKMAMWFFFAIAVAALLVADLSLIPGLSIGGAVLVILALQFWLGKREYVGYDCNGRLLLMLARTPSQDVVEKFMERIREKKSEYLKRTYAFVQPQRRPVDELQKLFALAKEGALTYPEYEAFKREIMVSYAMAIAPEPDETAAPN